MVVIIILIVIIIVIWYKYSKSNYQLDYDNITFFEGCIGSGKTTIMTHLALKTRRRRIIRNFFTKPINIIVNIFLCICPIIHLIYIPLCIKEKKFIWKIQKQGTTIYSNYPIYISKKVGYSIAINKDLLNWLYRVNENCIIVLDEVGYLFPNEMQKTDPLYTFCMTWLRHGTNCMLFASSQCLDECNISFRRKVNRVYHLRNMKRCLIPCFSKVQIHSAIISEDMNTITKDDTETREQNWYRFKYPRNRFASRYAKNLYKLDNNKIKELSINYQKTFEKMNMKNGDQWKSLYYEL